MSYYACAPLAWTPLPWVLVIVSFAIKDLDSAAIGSVVINNPDDYAAGLGAIAFLLAIAQVAVWWGLLCRLVERTTRPGPSGPLLMGVVLPILWLVLAGLILVGLPLLVGYVAVILISLRLG